MAFPLIVLDASAALALLLSDEEGKEVENMLSDTICHNGQIFVPSLFWFEVGNGMLMAERRNRISAADSSTADQYLSQLPIVTHAVADIAVRRGVTDLSRKHGLSLYDASYLELAVRCQAPLKTFDKHLLGIRDSVPLIC